MNEKLHNLYICSVFGAEQDLMKREKVDVVLHLPPMKVKKVLALMDNGSPPLGIFNMTDNKSSVKMGQKTMEEQVRDLMNDMLKDYQPKGTAGQEKMKDSLGNPIWWVDQKEKRKAKKDTGPTIFVISHSAKDVTYDCMNFIERNADKISKSLEECLIKKTGEQIGKIYSMKVLAG